MDTSVYSIKQTPDEKIDSLIKQRQSFVLEDIDRLNMSEAVASMEKLIESSGMRCRVYSKGRAASMAAAAIPTPVTVISGWASAIAIGAHNIVTWNPDYEIAKNLVTGTLAVTYKK